MAFVNIRGFMVDEAERKKYNDLYIKAGGTGGLGCEDWTIDRERNMLLVCLRTERENMYEGNFSRSHWVFYWHGEWVRFMQQDHGKKLGDSYFQVTREINEIMMPVSIKEVALAFFNELKEAFEAYRITGAGYRNPNLKVDLTLDISGLISSVEGK